MAGKNAHLLGKCENCVFWSSAANEARTLYALAQYTDPHADYDDCLRRAKQALSLDLLNPQSAEDRGWCKAAANVQSDQPPMLAVHLNSGTIGDLITARNFGCTQHKALPVPASKNNPDAHPTFHPKAAHEGLGQSASWGDIVLSYLPQGIALDPNQRMSPLHPEHPMNRKNPWNLAYNLVPAHAAWRQNGDLISRLAAPASYGAANWSDLLQRQAPPNTVREQKLPSTSRRPEPPIIPAPPKIDGN